MYFFFPGAVDHLLKELDIMCIFKAAWAAGSAVADKQWHLEDTPAAGRRISAYIPQTDSSSETSDAGSLTRRRQRDPNASALRSFASRKRTRCTVRVRVSERGVGGERDARGRAARNELALPIDSAVYVSGTLWIGSSLHSGNVNIDSVIYASVSVSVQSLASDTYRVRTCTFMCARCAKILRMQTICKTFVKNHICWFH